MDYDTLVSQHASIDSAIQVVLALLPTLPPQPVEAARLLDVVAVQLRDHFAVDDPVISETLVATRDTRHSEAAALSAQRLELLKRDWAHYLDRWGDAAIAADWTLFVEDSFVMFEHVHKRLTLEPAILYSLAYHHEIIGSRD